MENTPKKKRQGRKTQRTLAGAAALTLGLTGAGLLASALTPNAQVATAARDDQALIQEGKDLYDVACITCHGANLQGVQDRGPSLIGTGEGAVYFQVNSGRMPMMSNDAQAERKKPRYSEAQTLAMAAYVAANGGGPELVYNKDGSLAMEELRGKNFLTYWMMETPSAQNARPAVRPSSGVYRVYVHRPSSPWNFGSHGQNRYTPMKASALSTEMVSQILMPRSADFSRGSPSTGKRSLR